MKLPKVTGRNLLRQKMSFPSDFEGEVNLVFIAFQRWHQDHIDAWVPFVSGLAAEFPALHYYEFPTLPPGNLIYRTMLNEGMRAGIPNEATRGRTITLYLDKSSFRRALDIPDEDHIWTYLFDGQGEVLWRGRGPITDEKAAQLRSAVASALGEAGQPVPIDR